MPRCTVERGDMSKKKKITNALEILDRVTGKDPALRKLIEAERLNLRIAHMIRDGRIAADLTQQELADLVGTTQSSIARLESADYEGHSLLMLQRIADALDRRVEV